MPADLIDLRRAKDIDSPGQESNSKGNLYRQLRVHKVARL
jgi:hypothetical protein